MLKSMFDSLALLHQTPTKTCKNKRFTFSHSLGASLNDCLLHSTDLGTSVLAHHSMCIVGETSFSPLGSKREKGGSHSFLCSPDPYISKIFQQLLTLNFPPPPNSACHRISLTQYILFCRCLGIKQQTKPSSLVSVIFFVQST